MMVYQIKAYEKTIDDYMIERLNNLYKEKGSWWQTIVDEEQVFILVRKNALHVLIKGARLFKITMDKQNLVCETNKEHWLPEHRNDSKRTNSQYIRIEGEELMNNYDRIIENIQNVHEKDKERQCCHTISMNIKEIVEREVGLVIEKSETSSRNKPQFVDLQAVSSDSKMVFLEVKLLSNIEIIPPEMRPDGNQPKKYVVDQLEKYEDIIKSHKQKIIDAYTEQCETYSQLKGAFFKKKLPNPSNISIFPTVRLIITKYDEAPRREYSLTKIRKRIETRMGWEENTNNLIMIENPNDINAEDIFKGI